MVIKTKQSKTLFKSGQLMDLHIHTNYVDGKNSVEEILKEAERKNIKAISITDHNTVVAYKEINKKNLKKLYSGKIFVGMEINVTYKNYALEVLAYNFDINKIKKVSWFTKENYELVQKKRIQSLIKIADILGLEYNLKNLESYKSNGAVLFFDEILKYEKNKQILKQHKVKSLDHLYREQYQNEKGLFYTGYDGLYPTIEEIKKIINDAGGIIVLAHAFNVYKYKNETKIAKELAKNGLIDGIECYHRRYKQSDINCAIKIADKYGLVKTGGSDCHDLKKHPLAFALKSKQDIIL